MDTTTTAKKSLRCRLNLQHKWEWAHTQDGERYVRGARCHKERGDGRTGMPGAMMGMG